MTTELTENLKSKNPVVKKCLDDPFFYGVAEKIISSPNYAYLEKHLHHKNVSVAAHSLFVACRAYDYAKTKNLKVDLKVLITSALLHDYYFYDWHDKNKGFRLHGLKHGVFALKNAEKEFELTKKEKNAIVSHMFPLTFWLIPTCKEAWLICRFDKSTSIKEYSGELKV